MLTENDFDELGKRLYDLEADPPTGGFEKLRPALVPPAGGDERNTKSKLANHWWKPVLVIVPLTVFYLWSENTPMNGNLSDAMNATVSTENQTGLTNDEISGNLIANSTSETDSKLQSQGEHQPVTRWKDGTRNHIESAGSIHIETKQTDLDILDQYKKGESNPGGDNGRPILETVNGISDPTIVSSNDQRETGLFEDATNMSKLSRQSEIGSPDTLTVADYSDIDHGMIEEEIFSKEEDKEQKRKLKAWRISAGYAPQFIQRAVTSYNDEVLVTRLKGTSRYPQKVGQEFYFGIGRSVSSGLYLDANVSFARITQRLGYSYTNGRVDTLLATQDNNGNFRVQPVYQVSEEELNDRISYGGLRVTATYYFWSNSRRKFSLTAGAGVRQILSADIQQRVNGELTSFGKESLTRTSAALMIGAGYTITLPGNLELMVNPTLNYFPKNNSTYRQPFVMLQRSYGVNFMLSKNF